MTLRINVPAGIDPLSVILSTETYLVLQEKWNPHVPLIDLLKSSILEASPDQRSFMAGRARMVRDTCDAVLATLEQRR
jgi:hypothetical protein